ncbi:hypothetical protein NET03_10445 [Thermomicrobium sp. CFH 73360]|uniref:hypothetical protein n=1 Tax=Thermomicrobium sp. CFH 73360 TaxID=2951987 RepID=UPI0020778B87|nr:hypothetical protein [Thermomicrobium sp. CFH 73360]MCM8746942.1 hypothetical protein [Thermomicrobium sp. CFH 73360]
MRVADVLCRLVGTLSLVLLAAACATSSPPLPPYATQAGLLARDTCFGVEHLPGDFEVMARQIIDNPAAAQHDNPSLRPAQFEAWQRLSGAWLQYAYEPPSMPAEDADGFLSQDELEQALAQAHAERLDAPFTAAACRLDFFATAQRAEAAYQVLVQTTPGQSLPHRPRGDASQLRLASATLPGFARLTLWFRVENVLAAVSVTAPCNPHEPERCRQARDRTESLAALLLRRIITRVPGIHPLTTPSALDSRGSAELLCPERDYTSCVAEIMAAREAAQPFALCISSYGQWQLLPIIDGEPPRCPEDWTVAAEFGPRPTGS